MDILLKGALETPCEYPENPDGPDYVALPASAQDVPDGRVQVRGALDGGMYQAGAGRGN